MRRNYPPLKIHVWGGLGSQLFAVALVFHLKNKFPRRDLIIVLHSSGVTRRSPEVLNLFPEFNYIEVDDFSGRTSHDSGVPRKSVKRWVIELARFLALSSGLLAEENNETTRRAYPWTLSIRGHYFHRPISPAFIQTLASRLEATCDADFSLLIHEAAVHFRLGDLLELSNKKPIKSERISQVLQNLDNVKVVKVLSDSPEKALLLLKEKSNGKSLQALDLKTPETLLVGSRSNIFVGTSSKISYWVTLMRLINSPGKSTYMPSEDTDILKMISTTPNDVLFY